MEYLQTRLEVQGAVQQWVDYFIINNNVSPAMMEDALSKALLQVKELALQEYLSAVQAAQQKAVEEVQDEQDNQDTTERWE